jgi:16S rRNA (guanine527-N7)-methyltransferase
MAHFFLGNGQSFFSMGSMDSIAKVFPWLNGEQISLLAKYAELLREWNSKINLISRRDVENIVHRHIIPCLSIAAIGNFTENETALDIGTGGGLPGIPLAIAFGAVHFTLLDSIGKKITAVNDMILKLGLKNVKTVNLRAENFSEKFNKIVARAVANIADFMEYSEKLLAKNGKIFYLKGGDCSGDLKFLERCRIHSVASITGMDELSDKVILEIF